MGHFYLTLRAAIQVSCYHARFQPRWYSPRVNDACFFLNGNKECIYDSLYPLLNSSHMHKSKCYKLALYQMGIHFNGLVSRNYK